MSFKKMIFIFVFLMFLMFSINGFSSEISINKLNSFQTRVSDQKFLDHISHDYNLNDYREVRMEQKDGIHRNGEQAVLVLLLSKVFHRVDAAVYTFDAKGNLLSAETNYKVKSEDIRSVNKPKCPDTSVEFIAFCPNDVQIEQQVTIDVAEAAEAKGLKTVRLLKADATKQNYLNYMSCPNLKGNFYDGDSNPQLFITVDGEISSTEMSSLLNGAFHYKVTNIWLACQAFNDPMLSSIINDAQAQKYAAGKNDLLVGPSDLAAACAMKEALSGQPMTAAFNACYDKFDTKEDQWGFAGNGSDYFGQ